MRNLAIGLAIMLVWSFISCQKEKLCECDLSDSFDAYRYELDEVLPLSYSVYTYQGIKHPLEPYDTLIRYYYYQNLPALDSLIFSGETTGEFFTHSSRFNGEDTLIYMTSFNYTLEDNSYVLIPNDLRSTFVIDAYQEDHLKLLTLGKDDEAILNAAKRVFEIKENKLITEQYGIRLDLGSTSFELSVNDFNEAELSENLNMGEVVYIMHYQLEYARK